MKISLVVCTYNRDDILRVTLPYLLSLIIPDRTSVEVIIVNNNSTDNTKAVVDDFISEVNKLGNDSLEAKYAFESEQGLSHARNAGFVESRGEYIAYIDDECILPESWITEAIAIIEREAPAFLGGPYFGKYFPGSSSSWFEESFGDSYILQYELSDGPLQDRYISGGNMFIRRDVFEKVGLFDINLGMSGETINYGEEVELQKRFLKKYSKEVVWYDSKVFVWHCIRNVKMKITYLFKDALVRGASSASIREVSILERFFAPFLLVLYLIKALALALKKLLTSFITEDHFYSLLYQDYKKGAWRDIGTAWHNTKTLLNLK